MQITPNTSCLSVWNRILRDNWTVMGFGVLAGMTVKTPVLCDWHRLVFYHTTWCHMLEEGNHPSLLCSRNSFSSRRPCITFCNMLVFPVWYLLRPHPTKILESFRFWTIHHCLFITFVFIAIFEDSLLQMQCMELHTRWKRTYLTLSYIKNYYWKRLFLIQLGVLSIFMPGPLFLFFISSYHSSLSS